jgi:FkbM family methyltransferase
MERDLIYDIGMHRGEDTAFYLAMGYRVVGVEADPEHARFCQERFSAAIADGRVTIVEGAISNTGEPTVRFYRHPSVSVWGTTDTAWAERGLGQSEILEVPTIRLVEWLARTGTPYYMKIDVEGADIYCVEALRDLEVAPAYVSLESSQENMATIGEELDALAALGYDRFAVVQQANLPGRVIESTTIDGCPLRYQLEEHTSGPFGSDIGPWLTREQALARYRRVIPLYHFFDSRFFRTRLGRGLRGHGQRLLHLPMPGWFDTHAGHSSGAGARVAGGR